MSDAEQNKTLLLTLYDAVVHRAWDRVRSLLTDDFIDHNPGVAHDPAASDGREAFIGYFQKGATPLDEANVRIGRMIANEDFAVVHYLLTNPHHPGGLAVVDIFKVRDGRFSEHWDVLQPVPEESLNPHGMI